jgi:transcriptional regulator with XRE-family HTH domain
MDTANLSHTFSERIRKLRAERGMNQGQFADFVGVSRGAMSYYEQEARTPDIAVLKSICEKCGVSADYMLGLIPDRNHAVSDVCLETGLSPVSVHKLRLINKIVNTYTQSFEEMFDVYDDVQEAMETLAVTSVTEVLNVLLESDCGTSLLVLLGAIILGAEVYTGDVEPRVMIKSNSKNAELAYVLEKSDLTAALWLKIQEEANNLRRGLQERAIISNQQ